MKNFFKILGIIALTAVIGFSMAGCKNDDDGGNNSGSGGNPFVGTWTGEGMKLVCTASTWAITVTGEGNFSGSYTYNGNTANFKDTSGGNFGTATVSGNVMSVVSTYGTFAFSK